MNCPASAFSGNPAISSLSPAGAANFRLPYHRFIPMLLHTFASCPTIRLVAVPLNASCPQQHWHPYAHFDDFRRPYLIVSPTGRVLQYAALRNPVG